MFFEFFAPSISDDERCRRWWARYQRYCSCPSQVAASLRMHIEFDGRELLPQITAPTLVLHHRDDVIVPFASGAYLADHIPGARLQPLEGMDHMYWVGDQDSLLGHLKGFLAELPEGAELRTRKNPRRQMGFGWEALTDSEHGVVTLVEAGLSNREIATRLYVSPKTVETHLRHVFDKLGVDSRARLAAEAVRAEALAVNQ